MDQFVLQFSKKVKGLVLLDPATPFDHEFKENPTEAEYKNSGIDKTFSNKLGRLITGLGFSFTIKPLLLKSPPFYYYKFQKNAEDYILKALCRKRTYSTAIEEYKYTHNKDTTIKLCEAINNQGLRDIPLILLTHSSKFYVSELKQFANLDICTAEKVENIWQGLNEALLETLV